MISRTSGIIWTRLPSGLATRGFQFSLEQFRELDSSRRAAIRETEELKAQKNAASEEIGKLKRQGVDTSEQQKKIRELGDRIAVLDKNVEQIDEEFKTAAGRDSECSRRVGPGGEERGR